MFEEVEIIVNWLSEEDDEINQYRLRIYWLDWMRAVVIASNITVFPKRKIVDITPQIIRLVKNSFAVFPNKIMLIEHYPLSNVLGRDVYLHLLFFNNEVTRYEISKNELISITGKFIEQKKSG